MKGKEDESKSGIGLWVLRKIKDKMPRNEKKGEIDGKIRERGKKSSKRMREEEREGEIGIMVRNV